VRHVSLELIQYLIELYPEAVISTDKSGNLPLHRACSVAPASDAVIQLLLNRYAGDEANRCGSSVANYDGQLPLHCYCSTKGTGTGAMQQLVDLYPQAVHVSDTNGMLPLHVACSTARSSLDIIRLLVEADLFTVVQNSRNGSTPYQLAWRLSNERKNVEVEAYLIERQNEAIAALKSAYESVAVTQLGLPDLVVAMIWSFAKPDIWMPPA
jgi:ankyrin repeat protein